MVSVSEDGVAIPKIYEKHDILAYNAAGNQVLPSELIKINGEDAVTFLKSWAQLGALQDPDALYNNVFYEMAFDAQQYDVYAGYFGGSGRFGLIYPGPETTLEFANGTKSVLENQAYVFLEREDIFDQRASPNTGALNMPRPQKKLQCIDKDVNRSVIGNFSRIVDGKSFYFRFCTGPHLQRIDSNITYPFPLPPPLPPVGLTPPFGYPTPVVVSGDTQVSGYYLDDGNNGTYSDVAVLSMLSFAPNFPIEFQSVVQTFIQKAREKGKTKLVIDLSGNGGGTSKYTLPNL